eukprot:g4474.t1
MRSKIFILLFNLALIESLSLRTTIEPASSSDYIADQKVVPRVSQSLDAYSEKNVHSRKFSEAKSFADGLSMPRERTEEQEDRRQQVLQNPVNSNFIVGDIPDTPGAVASSAVATGYGKTPGDAISKAKLKLQSKSSAKALAWVGGKKWNSPPTYIKSDLLRDLLFSRNELQPARDKPLIKESLKSEP